MPVQDSSQSDGFAAVLVQIIDRLEAFFTKRGFVVATTTPESRIAEYKGQDGLFVSVDPPRPFPLDGAGRYGRRTNRDIVVSVITANIRDTPPSDKIAMLAHIAREDEVANVLDQLPPETLAYCKRVGIQIRYLGGDLEMSRKIASASSNPSIMVSSLRFRAEHNQPMKVNRS